MDPQRIPTLDLLLKAIGKGRIAHAYLLHSKDRKVLEAAARHIALLLLCRGPSGDALTGNGPCGQCQSCQLVLQGRHPDLFQLRPRGKLRQIQIDEIRQLERAIYQCSFFGGYQVVVIFDADRMNVNAANAFLKTLEEPPPNVVILLLTEEPERLLETVRSRCLRIDFRQPEKPEWTAEQLGWLKAFASDLAERPDDVLVHYRALAKLIGILEDLHSQIEEQIPRLPDDEQEAVDGEIRKALDSERNALIDAGYRDARRRFLRVLVWWARDIWLATVGVSDEHWCFRELATTTKRVATLLTPDAARRLVREVERSIELLETNVQEALALEALLLKIRFRALKDL